MYMCVCVCVCVCKRMGVVTELTPVFVLQVGAKVALRMVEEKLSKAEKAAERLRLRATEEGRTDAVGVNVSRELAEVCMCILCVEYVFTYSWDAAT